MVRAAPLARLPVRGEGVRELGLPLPARDEPAVGEGAARMPPFEAWRPLKRWRYLAAFGPELMLCAGDARIGPLRQRWWALAEPDVELLERTSAGSAGISLRGRAVAGSPPAEREPAGGGAAIELRIRAKELRAELSVETAGSRPVEVVSPSGRRGWAWTRKRAGLPARAAIDLRGRRRTLELEAVIDDSAGYHERHTAWRWSTGVGRASSGERIAWNLVTGIHDSPAASERALWVDGEPIAVAPVAIAPDLAAIRFDGGAELRFRAWSAREHRTNLLLFRSAYRQPFGTFDGELPGGLALAEGYGVMEEHDVRW